MNYTPLWLQLFAFANNCVNFYQFTSCDKKQMWIKYESLLLEIHSLVKLVAIAQILHEGKATDKRGYLEQFKDIFSYSSIKTYVVTPH